MTSNHKWVNSRDCRAWSRRGPWALLLLSSVSVLGCGSEGVEGEGSTAAVRERLGGPAGAAGFSDAFDRKGLQGWTTVGGRRWQEKTSGLTTLSPGTLQKTGGTRAGFIVSNYPSADNGTFETTLSLDPWNGDQGGVVFRWSSPQSFYYLSLKPGNEWTSQLSFGVNSTRPADLRVVAQKFKVGGTVKLKLEVNGSTFKVYLDGVLQATIQDNTNEFGRVGYAYSDYWDNHLSVLDSQWVDAVGAHASQAVDPRAGKVALTVHVKDDGFDEANMLKPRIYVENTGEVTVGDFSAYYLFTAEPGKVPVLQDWHTPESTPSLISLGDDKYAVEYQFAGLELAPGERTPNPDGNAVGIHYADWSAHDKSNDYSNPSGRDWQLTQTVPVEGVFRGGTTFGGDPNAPDVNRLVGGSIPSRKAQMKRLVMRRLRCEDTTADSDFWGGEDHVAVVVSLDGQQAKSINAGGMDELGDQSDDDPKNYFFSDADNTALEFTSTARVSLFDYEGVSFSVMDYEVLGWEGTDFIGGHDLDVTATSETTKVFSRDGQYRLYYKVEAFEVDKTFPTLAEYQLEAFSKSTKPGMWSHIDKDTLIKDVTARLKTPEGVYQGRLDYCGPAATTYLLVGRRPLRYVNLVRSLYETGTYSAVDNNYVASAALRGCNVPTGQGITNVADWLVMATISDARAANSSERISADADGNPIVDGQSDLRGTRPLDHKVWMKDIVGYNYVDFDTSYFWGEETILSKADTATKRGGAAMLGIKKPFFEDGAFPDFFWDQFLTQPSHTIAYVGDLNIGGGDWYDWDSATFKFRYWTWGEIREKSINEGRLEDSLIQGVIGE